MRDILLNPLPQSFHWWKVAIAIDIAAAPYGDCRDAVVTICIDLICFILSMNLCSKRQDQNQINVMM